MVAKVQTVLGPVVPEALGKTLTHEHFALDFDKFYVAPPKSIENVFDDAIRLDNVGYIRQYPYSSKCNIRFCDNDTHTAVKYDVSTYKNAGGGTIVENTSHGLGRNLQLMKDVSIASGVNVVAGTGTFNLKCLEFEIRAIRATAEVQEHLGCPVSFHPGRHPKAPFEIMRLFN